MAAPRRLLFFFLGGMTLTLGGLLVYLNLGLPDVRQVQNFRPDGSITMTARNGAVIYNQGSGPQQKTASQQLPEVLKKAAIASEDRRFYEHNGVDLMGIARALVSNVRQGELAEGGSTITQQLARVLFLSQDKNLGRKFQEALLALKLEQTYSKDEILTYYLNYSYFGSGAYGVADASHVYFNKPVSRLTLNEAALLIGLLPAPSIYSPINNPDLARKRRDIVLERMTRAGFITENQRREAMARAPRYRFNRVDRSANAYFTTYVLDQLPNFIDKDVLENGGLTVETTLDVQAQSTAQSTLRRRLQAQRRVEQGAVVSLDPATGEVRALVGGVDYEASKFNRATQARRQPGSAFKTFVYLTALEQGYAPTLTYVDRPIAINGYQPRNADGEYRGAMNLMDALAQSRNPIAVQLLLDVGIDRTIATCRRLGITTPLSNNASLALGSSEVQLLEFTSAYAVLANGGVRIPPWAIRRVKNRQGETIYEARPHGERVVASDIAWMMTQFLAHVVATGTGRATDVPFPAAGKTGTTDGGRDLLFVGYTPKLVTGVWLGNDDSRPTGASSRLAAQIWGAYMRQITPADSPDFAVPPGLRPETHDLILAALEGFTSERDQPFSSSESWTEQPIPQAEEAPAPDEEPTFDSGLAALDPLSDCYDRETRLRDRRCRNRKN
ncbi:transglycosylase domain-containing protein [Anthocerotibacter panamensis]|uniref:transglycosylase domain-containing protein n=1 Tax=Anthocerotibacter panamensis TaxID=2857077 RepID=UPI001C407903|nr:PBP1A family penicillin-binding protein [Anthocerotibacter panamensis]